MQFSGPQITSPSMGSSAVPSPAPYSRVPPLTTTDVSLLFIRKLGGFQSPSGRLAKRNVALAGIRTPDRPARSLIATTSR
jgi:hypothetical protein